MMCQSSSDTIGSSDCWRVLIPNIWSFGKRGYSFSMTKMYQFFSELYWRFRFSSIFRESTSKSRAHGCVAWNYPRFYIFCSVTGWESVDNKVGSTGEATFQFPKKRWSEIDVNGVKTTMHKNGRFGQPFCKFIDLQAAIATDTVCKNSKDS